jgi:hypothetical protein
MDIVADFYIRIEKQVLDQLAVNTTQQARDNQLTELPSHPGKSPEANEGFSTTVNKGVAKQLPTTMPSTPGSRYGLHISLVTNELKPRPAVKTMETQNKQLSQERTSVTPSRFKPPLIRDSLKELTNKRPLASEETACMPSTAEVLLKETLHKRKLSQQNQVEAFFKELHATVTQSHLISDKQLSVANQLLTKAKHIEEFTGDLFPVAVELLVELSKLQPRTQLTLPQLTRLSQLLSVSLPEVVEEMQEAPEEEGQIVEAEASLRRAIANLSIKYISVRFTQELKSLRQLSYEDACVFSGLLTLFAEIDSHISVLPSFKIMESQLKDNYRTYFTQPGSVINSLRSFEQLVKSNQISAEAVRRTKDYLAKIPQTTDCEHTALLKQYLEAAVLYYDQATAHSNKADQTEHRPLNSSDKCQSSRASLVCPPKSQGSTSTASSERKLKLPPALRPKRQQFVRNVYTPMRSRGSKDFAVDALSQGEMSRVFKEFIRIKLGHFRSAEVMPTKAQAMSFAIANQQEWHKQFVSLYTNTEGFDDLFTEERLRTEVSTEFIEVRKPVSTRPSASWSTQVMAQERKRLERKRNLALKVHS